MKHNEQHIALYFCCHRLSLAPSTYKGLFISFRVCSLYWSNKRLMTYCSKAKDLGKTSGAQFSTQGVITRPFSSCTSITERQSDPCCCNRVGTWCNFCLQIKGYTQQPVTEKTAVFRGPCLSNVSPNFVFLFSILLQTGCFGVCNLKCSCSWARSGGNSHCDVTCWFWKHWLTVALVFFVASTYIPKLYRCHIS